MNYKNYYIYIFIINYTTIINFLKQSNETPYLRTDSFLIEFPLTVCHI